MAGPTRARRTLRPRTKTWIAAGAVSAVLALVVTAAVVWPGVDAQQTPVDDATVWALHTGNGNGYARVNLELGELDTVKEAENASTLTQTTDRLFVFSDGDAQFADVDMATPADLTADSEDAFAPTPSGTVDVVSAGDFVLYRTDAGGVFTATMSGGGTPVAIDPYAGAADAADDGEERPRFLASAVAVAPDGTAYLYSAAQQRVVRADAASGAVLAEDTVDGIAPDAEDVQVAVAGSRWVLFDPASGDLRVQGRSDAIETGASAAGLLQRASDDDGAIVIADGAGLVRVDLAAGTAARVLDAAGSPVTPAEQGGIVYAAWLSDGTGGGTLWSSRADAAIDLDYAGADIGDTIDAVFVANGARMALNERQSGWVWTVPDGALIPSSQQWDLEDPAQVEQNNDLEAERVVDPKPPVAVDDAFGARAGAATLLPVLLNDHDPNEDVLSIDPASIEGLDAAFGTVALAGAEQQLVIRLSESASGSATFRYRVTDGTTSDGLLSEPATVTVSAVADSDNRAPQWCAVEGCLATWPAPAVVPGGTITADALTGWVDPDGDPLYLLGARNDSGIGTVTTSPDGTVTYQHPDPNATEALTVSLTVTVSDSRGASAERVMSVAVTPSPELSARSFSVVGVVGEPVEIDVAPAITGHTGLVTLANALTLDEARSSVTANAAALSMAFTASAPGSYVVQFTVRDERSEVTATARVTMRDPAEVAISVPPLTAFVRPSEDATIDVFPAVSNPAGLVLLLSDIRAESDPLAALSVDLVGQSMLRVSGSTDSGAPGRLGVVRYTVSDGSGAASATAQGEITVILLPAPQADPPIAVDDAVTVRAGAQIDIPVLDNDSAASGALIAIDPSRIVNESDAGLAFATNRVVRYLAPDSPGVYAVGYTIFRLGFPDVTDTARVRITVVGSETNQAPVPRTLEGRVRSGESIRIPLTTFGVDPDGDAVTLDRIVSQPADGSAAISPEGDAIIYTSPEAFSGQVRFRYQVRDAENATGTADVRVGVLDGQSDPSPVTYSDYLQIQVGETSEAVVRPADNDVDPAGSTLTLTDVTPNAPPDSAEFDMLAGLLGPLDDGQVTLRAGTELGTFSYAYTVENETGDTAIGLIVVKVVRDPVPDYPVVQDTTLTIETREAFPRGIDVLDGMVSWNAGDVSGLRLRLWSPTPGISVDGWEISGEIPEVTLLIPFEVTGTAFDGTEVTSYGFLRVPGDRDIRLSLRADSARLDVREKESVDLDLAAAVAVPAGQTLELDAGGVAAGGARAEATCTATSGTTIRYDAGAGAPWTDTCVVPVKLAVQEDYTYLTVRIVVEAEIPQPVLRSASTTVSPGATATFDLDNMLGWAGKADPAGVEYATSYRGDQFDVVHDGAIVTVTAKDAARPGREEPVTVTLPSHPDAAAATLNLTVGPAPSVLPKGGSTVQRCSQSGGATSCTITVIGTGGEINPLPKTPLRLAGVTGPANCTGVSFSVADERTVRATWSADAAGAADCSGSFVVEDAQGRQSSGDRNGQVILDLQGLPANPTRVDWVAFSPASVTLRVISDGSSYPAVEGYRISAGGRVVATCSASGECPAIDAPVGEKIAYDARAFSSIGDSRAGVGVTAWAYRPPAAPTGASVTPVPNGTAGGTASITVTGLDATTGTVRLTGGAGAEEIATGGASSVTFPTYDVGSNSPTTLTATPLTRLDLPPIPGGSQTGATYSFQANGIGAPGLDLTVTASSTGEPGTITATATLAPNGVGDRIRVTFTLSSPCTVSDPAGTTKTVAATGGTASHTFTDQPLWSPITVYACAVTERDGAGFGVSQASGQDTPTRPILEPTGDATYTIGSAPAVSGGNGETFTWDSISGPSLTAPAPFQVVYRGGGRESRTFGDLFALGQNPGPVTARSCLISRCGDAERDVTATGAAYTARATFPTGCTAEGLPDRDPQIAAAAADRSVSRSESVDATANTVTFTYALTWTGALTGLDAVSYALTCTLPPPPTAPDPAPDSAPAP